MRMSDNSIKACAQAACQTLPDMCWCAGTLPMAAWANLSSMMSFSMRYNAMTGTLPNELATAWPKLAHLDLSNNRLAGKMPPHKHRAVSVWEGWSSVW